MVDLEGNELEVGTVYILPGASNQLVYAKFSHETQSSYIFKYVKGSRQDLNYLYTWNRQISKWNNHTNVPVIKMSDALLKRLNIC